MNRGASQEARWEEPSRELRQSPSPIAATSESASTFDEHGLLTARTPG